MILINLLPHREAARKLRRDIFKISMAAAVVVGLLISGAIYLWFQGRISDQQAQNRMLQGEIKRLEGQIKDIATLEVEIAALRARQQAVEDLQSDRNLPVHLLNELVKQTPEGIYFSTVRQDGQTLSVNGIAQTQERVSELLRNTAYNSEWLVKPELIESKSASVVAANKEQKRLFDFSVRLTVKRPQDKVAEPAAGASAPAAAASAANPNKG